MSQSKLIVLAGLLALGAVASAHAQRVTRDSVTGELRAPTAAEVKAMDSGKRSTRAVGVLSGKADPQAVHMPDGTVMQELTTDSLMYSVARKNADGSISQYCVHGEEAAQRLVKGKQARTQMISKAGKEVSYELK
jgi:hypothetical protein